MRCRLFGLATVVALAFPVVLGQEPLAGGVVSDFEPGHGFLSWFPAGVVADDLEVARFGEASLRLTSEGDARPVAAEVIDDLASRDAFARGSNGYPGGVTVPAPQAPAARIDAATEATP